VPIRWERDDSVGIATIDRPERRNALSADLCKDLTAHLLGNRDLRAVIVIGSGDKAFSAGADLAHRTSDTSTLEADGRDTFRPSFEVLLDSITGFPAPVLAAVNGAALGAGMQLAVACDLRIAAPHATFGIPSGRLGVLLSASNLQRLESLVGQAMARDLLFTARTLNVAEAELVGLVQRQARDVLGAAKKLAAEVATLAPLSIAGHKRALNLIAGELTAEKREEIEAMEAAAFQSADLQEGLTAFAEKRRPDFRGQ